MKKRLGVSHRNYSLLRKKFNKYLDVIQISYFSKKWGESYAPYEFAGILDDLESIEISLLAGRKEYDDFAIYE
jgi:hypothetical protein